MNRETAMATDMASERLLQAIAVTAELTGTLLSEAAARVVAADLAKFPEAQVLGALTRCRKELKGRLTLAEIISRLADGRPGPEEAWAMLPAGEHDTVVWTEEMRIAWGVVRNMLADGQRVAARMAFLERYRVLVAEARDAGVTVKWSATLGQDARGREAAITDAREKGRLSEEQVRCYLPVVEEVKALGAREGLHVHSNLRNVWE
jgi:hypothetical protein